MQCKDRVHLHRLAAQEPRYTRLRVAPSSPTQQHSSTQLSIFQSKQNDFQRILFLFSKITKGNKNCNLHWRDTDEPLFHSRFQLTFELLAAYRNTLTNKTAILFSCHWKIWSHLWKVNNFVYSLHFFCRPSTQGKRESTWRAKMFITQLCYFIRV